MTLFAWPTFGWLCLHTRTHDSGFDDNDRDEACRGTCTITMYHLKNTNDDSLNRARIFVESWSFPRYAPCQPISGLHEYHPSYPTGEGRVDENGKLMNGSPDKVTGAFKPVFSTPYNVTSRQQLIILGMIEVVQMPHATNPS